jgi:hypothetical protein
VRADIKELNICKTSEIEIDSANDFPNDSKVGIGNVDFKVSKNIELNFSDMIPDISDIGSLRVVLSENSLDQSENSNLTIKSAYMSFEYIDSSGIRRSENMGSYVNSGSETKVSFQSSQEIDLAKLARYGSGYLNISMEISASNPKSISLNHKLCANGFMHVEKNFLF